MKLRIVAFLITKIERLMHRLLLVLTLFFASSTLAQTTTLKGRIFDPSGAVVPNAMVTLTTPARPVQTVIADKAGAYLFAGVAPGIYAVEAATDDMEQAQPARLVVKPGLQTLDLRLKVKQVVHELTVQEDAGVALSTDSSNNASALVLSGDEMEALPDDPDDLQADLQALAGPSAGPNGGSIYIDGFSGGDLPAKNSIREIRVNQNPFSPEYDKLGYGRIEIFTKPGTNRYHGTVDYNVADRFWNSRNPYSPEKAPFLLNEFEGAASGPLNKLASFAIDAQRNMVDNGAITSAVALDPATLAIVPLSTTITSAQRLTKVSPRVDYQLNPNNTLIVRYGITDADIQNAGIGSFDLASRGYHTQYTNQTAQLAETAVLGQTLNETRFQYYRNNFRTTANTVAPVLRVLDAFNGGGAQSSRAFDVQNTFELQNYTSWVRRTHALKLGIRLFGQMDDSLSPQNFNGTFTFGGGDLGPLLGSNNQPVFDGSGQAQLVAVSSIERYRRTLLFQQLGYSQSQIRALGGGATQFSISAGRPELSVHQIDFAIFAGDEWRVRPNLTLSYGLRYEGQSNMCDWRDWAPRVSAAWAPGNRKKTVLRAGFGMFYDRFALGNTLTAARYNGVNQQQYVLTDPDFFPAVPSAGALNTAQSQTIEKISSGLRAPYLMQTAVTVERQIGANTALAVTYTNAQGLRMLRSVDINAPLPGTYNSSVSGSGVFPLGHAGPVFLMESSGRYNQNQLVTNVRTKLSAGTSLFAFYVFNKAMSNTDGVATFAANPYDSRGEYGPAVTDVRHRITAGGSAVMRWGVRVSPYLVIQSGSPFDITSGNDEYGTTLFNSRPGLTTNSSKAGLIQTKYGLLDPNPGSGEKLLGRNYGRGPSLVTMNLRIGKAIGFGPERETGGKSAQGSGSVPVDAVGNHGLNSILGRPATSQRYNLSISMSARNLLNHKNPGPIIGNITSPLFGESNQIAGTPNGEGFFETANNRRLEMQMRLTF